MDRSKNLSNKKHFKMSVFKITMLLMYIMPIFQASQVDKTQPNKEQETQEICYKRGKANVQARHAVE